MPWTSPGSARTATPRPRSRRAFPGGAENSLFEIANGSGGEVFRNANDLRGQLESLMTRTSLVYVLAFRPDQSRGEGIFHELKVKVAAPARACRRGPATTSAAAFRSLSPFERNLSAADVIANEIPMDEIPDADAGHGLRERASPRRRCRCCSRSRATVS